MYSLVLRKIYCEGLHEMRMDNSWYMEPRLRDCRLIDTSSLNLCPTAQLHNARPIGTYETARPHAIERGVQGGTHLSHFVFGFRAKQRLREAVWKTERTTNVKFCVSPSCAMRIALAWRTSHVGRCILCLPRWKEGGQSTKTIERFCDLTKTNNFEDVIYVWPLTGAEKAW